MGEITCVAALVVPSIGAASAAATKRIAGYLMIVSTSLKGFLTSLTY
jgi:hypothetical protein